ncbi:penicillin-binding protein 1A [Marinicauda pacifica]|nr:penicillin-binding protein 1A [Marinicauda pacifica]
MLVVALISFAVFWHWAFHDLPDLPEANSALWDVRREPAVTILDRQGRVLTVRGPRYGQAVTLDELPDHVPQAFIAIEDQRFYEHDGVDQQGTLRALAVNLRAGEIEQGGSTLTMQLIKNLILSPDRTVRRKVQEMRLALALERRLSKQEILELYLNRVYLGEQAYGIEAASQRYFDKPASELTLQQAALLAALPKAPSRLAPTANLDAAQARAQDVLQAMLEQGFIDEMTYLTAVSTPAEPIAGSELVADPAIFGHAYDAAVAEVTALLGEEELAPDLIVRTTIDADLQRAAHAAIMETINGAGADRTASQAALVSMTPEGAIRALVGGTDYTESQFNRAVQAERQPGSAFKPIVFAAALEAGYEPSSAFEDAPVDIDGWTPENFGGGYRGRVTIADALKRSINTVAVQVGAAIGTGPIVDMAERLGIDTPLAGHPSITLGAEEVTLKELTGAFLVFANDGVRRAPYLVEDVRTSRGSVLYQHDLTERSTALSQDTARAMSTMLQAVVRDGTGTRAQLGARPVAGKTGTSQNSRDAWFVGYTADFATGVWVGNDDDTAMANVTGGSLPATIWRDFMSEAEDGLPVTALNAPPPRRRSESEERLAAFYSELSSRFDALIEDPSGN